MSATAWFSSATCCARDAKALLTAEEVAQRYEGNRRALWPARITWTYTQLAGPVMKSNQAIQADRLRKRLRGDGVFPKERAELIKQLQDLEQMAKDPNAPAPTVVIQDFWTDGRAFQTRTPFAAKVPEGWSFPDVEANEQTLLRELSEIQILSVPDDGAEKGARVWLGDRRKQAGMMHLKQASWGSRQLPPLALAVPYEIESVHPFDQLFAAPIRELAVVGTKSTPSAELLTLERTEIVSGALENLMTDEERRRLAGRVGFFNLQTAWVDPARGCLPVRMEWSQRWTLDGREVFKTPAHIIVENVEIEQVADGVWYPRTSSMTTYAADESQELPKFSLTSILEGRPPSGRSGILQTFEWKVHKVQPRLELAQNFFALPFPNGSIVLDHDKNRLVAVGDRSAVLNRIVAAPGVVTGDQPTSRTFIWLIGANVLVLALIIVAWRMNKKRRPPGASQGSN